MTKLIAFLGDKNLKKELLKQVKKHEDADQIEQGTYGEQNGEWKGCAVACSLRSLSIVQKKKLVTRYDQHARYETDLGISQTIARLEDKLFEGMTVKDARVFPRKFIEAIPVGADLSLVPAKFMIFCINETLKNFDNDKFPDVVKAIEGVTKIWQDVIDGKYIGKDKELESAAWSASSAAKSAAWSASSAAKSAESAERSAWSAAWSAESASSAAWSAAWSAARSAESAAKSAAWSAESAAKSAAWSAAWSASSAAYKRLAEHLLSLLENAPIV